MLAWIKHEAALWRRAVVAMTRTPGFLFDGLVALLGFMATPGGLTWRAVFVGAGCGAGSRLIRCRKRERTNELEIDACRIYPKLRYIGLNGINAIDALDWAKREWPRGFTRPQMVEAIVEEWSEEARADANKLADELIAALLGDRCIRRIERTPNTDYRITALGKHVVTIAERDAKRSSNLPYPELE